MIVARDFCRSSRWSIGLVVWFHVSAVAQTRAEHGVGPAVSPDGQRVAFTSTRDGSPGLYVIGADGSGIHRVSSVEGSARPTWSQDGHSLFVTRRSGDTTLVLSISLDGGQERVVGRTTSALGGATLFPDAGRLAYGTGTWQQTQLETSRSDGSDRRRLTHDDASYWCPQVSPDGAHIAAGRRDKAGWQLWIANTDGSASRALVTLRSGEGSTECPRWSADGRRIVFQSGKRSARDTTKTISHVNVVNVADGRVSRLASHDDPWRDETPSWFPNGERIAFQSDRTGAWEIWIMNADGSSLHQLERPPQSSR